MWCFVVCVLMCHSVMYAADVGHITECKKRGMFPGAAYFVIHTRDGSTVYRAHTQVIHAAPNFYKIQMPGLTTLISPGKIIHGVGAIVTFHGADTEMVDGGIKRDDTPFENMKRWQDMLDPAAKVYVYKAIMSPRLHKLKLYDKRNDLITELEIRWREETLMEHYKDIIDLYADSSKLAYCNYKWHSEKNGNEDVFSLQSQTNPKSPQKNNEGGCTIQ